MRGLGALAYLLFVLAPLAVLFLQLVLDLLAGQLTWLALAVPNERRLLLLGRSIGLAASVSAGSTVLGLFAGSVLWRWRSGAGRLLRWFLLALVPIPAYLHALGWSSFMVKLNAALTALGIPHLAFRGWGASWWVQLMAFAPISIGFALIAFESIDPTMIDAARTLRPDVEGLKRIILPLAAPLILAGSAVTFLLSLIDYSVPSLFHVSTYALDIFAEFSANHQPSRALILALPLLLINLGVIGFLLSRLRQAALRPAWKRHVWEVAPEWPLWVSHLQRLGLMLLATQIAVPLISQLLLAGPPGNFLASINAAQEEVGTSLKIALLASLLSLPLSLPIATQLLKGGKHQAIWWTTTLFPLIVPAPLIGIGLISLWNRPATHAIYVSLLMPMLASIVRFAPVGAIILLAQLRRMDHELIEAAYILQKSSLQTLFEVKIPLLLPGLLATAGFVFVFSTGELGATLLVIPPGEETLTLRIYNYLHYGATDVVASLGLLMTFLAFLFGSSAALLWAGSTKLLSRNWK
jgi:iron(III) transport system permease protein